MEGVLEAMRNATALDNIVYARAKELQGLDFAFFRYLRRAAPPDGLSNRDAPWYGDKLHQQPMARS